MEESQKKSRDNDIAKLPIDVFTKIKKQNGESFAKAIRNYDNGIFDIPEIDKIVKFAGRDAEPVMNYLISLKNIKIEEHGVYKDPITLLKEAGYVAYYADTLEKQNKILPFFAEGEELCTFNDTNRYKKYHIINAVREDVKHIKRSETPQREDEYGTSVLSIQVLKSGGFISIKNRYNHTVTNPDNTLNSNPDNIIEGLSEAIKHHYHVDFSSQKVNLPENFIYINEQIIKYDKEINNVYFGEDVYVKDGEIYEIDKNKFVIDKSERLELDYFVLDLKSKTVSSSRREDGFIKALNQEIKDKKLEIVENKQGNKDLFADGVKLLELKEGKIISLNLPNVTTIGNYFLHHNRSLTELSLPRVTTVGELFLHNNCILTKLSMPRVTDVGHTFLYNNRSLTELSMQNVTDVGNRFLYYNDSLTELSMPNVTHVGDDFLHSNHSLTELSMSNVTDVGYGFLKQNNSLTEASLPNVTTVENDFLYSNHSLTELSMPRVTTVGKGFLCCNNNSLTELSMPNVTTIGDKFLYCNNSLTKLSLPNVTTIGNNFLCNNESLTELSLPNVTTVGKEGFLEKHPNKKSLRKTMKGNNRNNNSIISKINSIISKIEGGR